MATVAAPHLNFAGSARRALEFYRSIFGGHLVVSTYAEFGMPPEVPGSDQVVFGQVDNGQGFSVMAYDVPPQGAAELASATPATRRENGTTVTNQPFFLSLNGESIEEVEPLWKRLAEGASVIEDFGPAQWTPAFGMLTDQFGVTWVVGVSPAAS